MKKNTFTVVGNLRSGDRFRFLTWPSEFEVMAQLDFITAINEIHGSGFKYKKEEAIPHLMPVMFLGHTKPQPGEDCLINQLKPGDTFRIGIDSKTEYKLIEFETKAICVEVADVKKATPFFKMTDTVTLIKRNAAR